MTEKLEQVARAIAYAMQKDRVASTSYETGRVTYMRDLVTPESIFVDEVHREAARAAIAAMEEV